MLTWVSTADCALLKFTEAPSHILRAPQYWYIYYHISCSDNSRLVHEPSAGSAQMLPLVSTRSIIHNDVTKQ